MDPMSASMPKIAAKARITALISSFPTLADSLDAADPVARAAREARGFRLTFEVRVLGGFDQTRVDRVECTDTHHREKPAIHFTRDEGRDAAGHADMEPRGVRAEGVVTRALGLADVRCQMCRRVRRPDSAVLAA